jgi:hypothetical protein
MSNFPERLAEAVVKSLSQKDLEEFYTYIKFLHIALTTLQMPLCCLLGSVIGYTIKRRKVLLRKWGKLQVLLVNLSVFIFIGLPIFSTLRNIVNLNLAANLMYGSLSNLAPSPNGFWRVQVFIGLAQVLLLSIFASRQIGLSKK